MFQMSIDAINVKLVSVLSELDAFKQKSSEMIGDLLAEELNLKLKAVHEALDELHKELNIRQGGESEKTFKELIQEQVTGLYKIQKQLEH